MHILHYEDQELDIWSELSHPNIVRFYGAIRHGEKIYMFAEFIDGETCFCFSAGCVFVFKVLRCTLTVQLHVVIVYKFLTSMGATLPAGGRKPVFENF